MELTTTQSFIGSVTTYSSAAFETTSATEPSVSSKQPHVTSPDVFSSWTTSEYHPTESHTDVSVFLWTTQPSGVVTEMAYLPTTQQVLTTVEAIITESPQTDVTVTGNLIPSLRPVTTDSGDTSQLPTDATEISAVTVEGQTQKYDFNATVIVTNHPASITKISPKPNSEVTVPMEVPTSQLPLSPKGGISESATPGVETQTHKPSTDLAIPFPTSHIYTPLAGGTTTITESRSSTEEGYPTPGPTDDTSLHIVQGSTATVSEWPGATNDMISTTPTPRPKNVSSMKPTDVTTSQSGTNVTAVTAPMTSSTASTNITRAQTNISARPRTATSPATTTETSEIATYQTVITEPLDTSWSVLPSESPGWINSSGTPYMGDCPEASCQNGGTCIDGIRVSALDLTNEPARLRPSVMKTDWFHSACNENQLVSKSLQCNSSSLKVLVMKNNQVIWREF